MSAYLAKLVSRDSFALSGVDSAGVLRELFWAGDQLIPEGQASGPEVESFEVLTESRGSSGVTRSFNGAGQVALLVITDTRPERPDSIVRIDLPEPPVLRSES